MTARRSAGPDGGDRRAGSGETTDSGRFASVTRWHSRPPRRDDEAVIAALTEFLHISVADLLERHSTAGAAASLAATLRGHHAAGVLLDFSGVTAVPDDELEDLVDLAMTPMQQGVDTRMAGLSPELAEKLAARSAQHSQ